MQSSSQSESPPSRRGISTGWTALAWTGWWLLALWPLTGHWATNPQYTYGWLVPPLAVLLLWRRWRSRPEPGEPARWSMPIVLAMAATFFPVWLVVAANPGWRTAEGLLTLCAVAGTVSLAARLGGVRWAWHFAFPIAFILTAVPWPSYIEDSLMQGLMRFVAGVTVVLLNAGGIPAVQRGNLIEVVAGVLGVDEACSGVRSLQAAFMAALFLGEFHRLKSGARFALLAAGFAVAVLTNIARTAFLSYSAAHDGVASVAKWHDPAGYTILSVCLVSIALLAEWLRARHSATVVPSSAIPAHLPPARAGVMLAAWLVFAVVATEAWYWRKPAGDTPLWTVATPEGATEEPLPAASLAMLGCDRTRSANWRDDSGARWTLYFLEWRPRRSRAAVLAQVHRPDVCLPGIGYVEAGPQRPLAVSAAGFDLIFTSMHFRDPDGRDAFAFYCPWEFLPGEPGRNAVFGNFTQAASLRRVWQRERVLGLQVAEMIVTGARSREAAEAAFRGQFSRLIHRTVLPAESK